MPPDRELEQQPSTPARQDTAARTSYLRRVLADGARPYLYRARVRSLLGMPAPFDSAQDEGVALDFATTSMPPGFAYADPEAEEFDLQLEEDASIKVSEFSQLDPDLIDPLHDRVSALTRSGGSLSDHFDERAGGQESPAGEQDLRSRPARSEAGLADGESKTELRGGGEPEAALDTRHDAGRRPRRRPVLRRLARRLKSPAPRWP